MIVNVLFYVFGAILVLTALGVITARNPVHCALFLVAAFLNSAVIWLLLQAEFTQRYQAASVSVSASVSASVWKSGFDPSY